MANITTKDFSTLVSDMATAIQGAANALVDMTIGSILRSVVEANAAVVLWLEGLILTLLATSRAATSSSTDLDSWVADYGLTRLAAVAATGNVTFARFTPTNQAVIPVGTVVQTNDGSQKYSVTLNTANPAYSAISGGYVIGAGVSSVTVPVAAQVAGSAGNAAASIINTLTQAISGVDTVTNGLQFTTGADAETDTALRARFVTYINSLSKATKSAIQNAVLALGPSMATTLVENLTYAGAASPGYFFAVVDDGSGAPPVGTLTAAWNAIDAVRPIGSTFGVYAPVVVTSNVAMTVGVVSGYDPAATKTAVQSALQTFINSLTLGTSLQYSRLLQVAYDASAGVQNVTAVTLNSGTSDLAATNLQVIKCGTVTVI